MQIDLFNIKLPKIIFVLFLSLESCFIIKVPIKNNKAISASDTINIYHFILTTRYNNLIDTGQLAAIKRNSFIAFNWITEESAKYNKVIIFNENWVENKNEFLKTNFYYILPSKSLLELTRKSNFKTLIQKRTKNKKEIIKRIKWEEALLDSISNQVNDTNLAEIIKTREYQSQKNMLLMIHILRPRKSKIQGFYHKNSIYIGDNSSSTIAHESLHHFSAPDLYIHRFWIGKRRSIVKNNLIGEIMNFPIKKKIECADYYISNYTAYTMKWTDELIREYRPLTKYNLMAKLNFIFSLF